MINIDQNPGDQNLADGNISNANFNEPPVIEDDSVAAFLEGKHLANIEYFKKDHDELDNII